MCAEALGQTGGGGQVVGLEIIGERIGEEGDVAG